MKNQSFAAKHHLVFFLFTVILSSYTAVVLAADPVIDVTAHFSPSPVQNNGNSVLAIDIAIPRGFILYSPTRIEEGPKPLSMTVDNQALRARTPWHGPSPQVKFDEAFGKKVEYYSSAATFSRVYQVSSFSKQSTPIHITGQICDHQSCYNQRLTLNVPLQTAADGKSVAPTLQSGIAFDENHQVGDVTTSFTQKKNEPEKLGLLAFLLMAVLAGFGALLTPCVFPMIPITISFFSKYENVSKRVTILVAGVYAGSIIIVYTVPGVLLSMIFGAGSMQTISTHPAFNVFISGLLIFFGLNLIGLFELHLPSALINKSAAREQQLSQNSGPLRNQLLGVFFMAVTFTLVSFSCTVGFVGGWVLPLAARGEAFYPLVGMFAFSSAFALPFFVLAIFPRWVQSIQGKAGDWMLAVKVVFGVVELAAAMKFVSNLDLHFSLGLITRDVALIVWSAAFIMGTLLVLNVFHKEQFRPTIPKIAMAILLLGFAAKSAAGIGNTRPLGGWVDGWLPPVPYPTAQSAEQTPSGDHLPFMQDSLNDAMETARKSNMPLFVDFTGFQCANCRQMESNYFPKPTVRERLAQMTRVKLYTDGPKPIHNKQREYQFNRFETAVLPYYVILNPYTDQVLADFSSLASNEMEFVAFLDKGLAAFTRSLDHQDTSSVASPKNDRPASASVRLSTSGPPVAFTLPTLIQRKQRKPTSLSSFRGKWVLVNFWASYCAPCKTELKNEFPAALAAFPEVKLVTVALEPSDTIKQAQQFMESLPLSNQVHLLADEDWSDEALPSPFKKQFGMPSSFLIHPDGFISWAHTGSLSKADLFQALEQIK